MLKQVSKLSAMLIAASLTLFPFAQVNADTNELNPVMEAYFPVDLEGHWGEDFLTDFVEADVIRGFVNTDNETEIRPDQTITRAEFVTFLVKGMGISDISASNAKVFTDVKADSWYFKFVNIASSLGIVSGKTETTFAPDANITRGEMATMVVNAFNQSLSFEGETKAFTDVPDYWAKTFIDKASKAELISGYPGSNNMFKPFENATRAEGLVVLYKALMKEDASVVEDSVLEDLVIESEAAFTAGANDADYEQLQSLTEQYALGSYKAFMQLVFEQLQAVTDTGVELSFELTGDIAAVVIEKSDRYAIVELTGADYEVTINDGVEETIELQDSNGLVHLRKVLDSSNKATWKIYRMYQVVDEETQQEEEPSTSDETDTETETDVTTGDGTEEETSDTPVTEPTGTEVNVGDGTNTDTEGEESVVSDEDTASEEAVATEQETVSTTGQ